MFVKLTTKSKEQCRKGQSVYIRFQVEGVAYAKGLGATKEQSWLVQEVKVLGVGKQGLVTPITGSGEQLKWKDAIVFTL